jgi:hypothetical protein
VALCEIFPVVHRVKLTCVTPVCLTEAGFLEQKHVPQAVIATFLRRGFAPAGYEYTVPMGLCLAINWNYQIVIKVLASSHKMMWHLFRRGFALRNLSRVLFSEILELRVGNHRICCTA